MLFLLEEADMNKLLMQLLFRGQTCMINICSLSPMSYMCVLLYCNFDGMSNKYFIMPFLYSTRKHAFFIPWRDLGSWQTREKINNIKKGWLQITIAQTSELSSFKRYNINAHILSVSNLNSIEYRARTVPVLYYFRKVSFRRLGKETFKLVKTFIISVQDSSRCYFVLCTPWLAQGGKGRNQHRLILVL